MRPPSTAGGCRGDQEGCSTCITMRHRWPPRRAATAAARWAACALLAGYLGWCAWELAGTLDMETRQLASIFDVAPLPPPRRAADPPRAMAAPAAIERYLGEYDAPLPRVMAAYAARYPEAPPPQAPKPGATLALSF